MILPAASLANHVWTSPFLRQIRFFEGQPFGGDKDQNCTAAGVDPTRDEFLPQLGPFKRRSPHPRTLLVGDLAGQRGLLIAEHLAGFQSADLAISFRHLGKHKGPLKSLGATERSIAPISCRTNANSRKPSQAGRIIRSDLRSRRNVELEHTGFGRPDSVKNLQGLVRQHS